MSLLSYFLCKTHAPEKFELLVKYITIDGNKISSSELESDAKCTSCEMGHKVYMKDNKIFYETFMSNGEKIVRNHLSQHDSKGNLLKLTTYFGDNDKYDTSFDVCYVVDLINDTLSMFDLNGNNIFWDNVVINETESLNFSVQEFAPGFLISQNQTYNPKQINVNGKAIVDILGSNLEICYIDYLTYKDLNVMMYCTKYDIEQEITNNINSTASGIAKRKIVGHCVMTSNENLDSTMMAKIMLSALSFDQKKYEEMQKKNLLKMYAQAYVAQHPKN